jgi:hypothetical protein
MPASLVFFILIHLVVFVFFIETLRRVAKRANEYSLKDTRRTLPFGIVRLRHMVIIYVLGYIIWIIVSIILYLTFVDSSSSFSLQNGQRPGTTRSVELNL